MFEIRIVGSVLDKWKHIMGLVKFLDNQYSFENRIIVYDFKYSVGGRVEMIKVC